MHFSEPSAQSVLWRCLTGCLPATFRATKDLTNSCLAIETPPSRQHRRQDLSGRLTILTNRTTACLHVLQPSLFGSAVSAMSLPLAGKASTMPCLYPPRTYGIHAGEPAGPRRQIAHLSVCLMLSSVQPPNLVPHLTTYCLSSSEFRSGIAKLPQPSRLSYRRNKSKTTF